MCDAGVDVREAAQCKHEPSRNRRFVFWRANVATWSSCILTVLGAAQVNLRRAADETRESRSTTENRWMELLCSALSRGAVSHFMSRFAAAVVYSMLPQTCRALPLGTLPAAWSPPIASSLGPFLLRPGRAPHNTNLPTLSRH
jgi:hypothetical protein